MKPATYAALEATRRDFRALVEEWSAAVPGLAALQDELRESLGYDDYRVETPVVYNRDLDALGPESRVAIILVADNPGKKEQLARNNRYLVGQSGKLAEGWFARELKLDFRKDVLILNKTPLHTPKTAELRKLLVLAGAPGTKRRSALESLVRDSQAAMAELAFRLHAASEAPLWISGYGELGPKGLFRPYAEALGRLYADAAPALRDRVWLFRHFSMNQFAIEMKEKRDPRGSLMEELARIGAENRKRILGW
ncbi:MAG: hypothetical protein JNG85_10375 [Spirochaetaceae bacterium]|nr:hypothetical protein [Spirochaetaceae bacterium]